MVPSNPRKLAIQHALLCSLAVFATILVSLLVSFDRSRAQQPEELSRNPIALPGTPVSPDHSKFSEHNIQWVKTQPAQVQMEFLFGAAINHDQGATDLIAKYVARWHGKLRRTPGWQDLETTALYSNDLRVRATAIEINLAVNNLAKTDETASRLLESGEAAVNYRPWSAWELGMLANRGVQTARIQQWLTTWAHDQDQPTRFWAVEGLAHLGTDDTIKDFLDVLRNDPSLDVRERAACSLAKAC